MKLKEWATLAGINYLTAYRWYKAGTLPVKAHQTQSGTILVDDEELLNINQKSSEQNADVTAHFFKKTLEYSKNNSTIEDFAAYIFSNFDLNLKEKETTPKYSKNKPKSEDIQNHFKSFLPVQGKKPEPNMFIPGPEILETLTPKEERPTSFISDSPTVSEEINSLACNYSTLLDNTGSSSFGGGTFPIQNLVEPNSISFSDQNNGALILNTNYTAPLSFNQTPSSNIYFTSNNTPSPDKPKRGRPRKTK